MVSPETGEIPIKPEQKIEEHQEEFVVPEKIQDVGVKTTRTQATTQVNDDDDDNQIIKTPTRQVTVTLPAQQETIEHWAKGDTKQSSTWLGFFWVRIIKKALHFGWKLVVGSGTEDGKR